MNISPISNRQQNKGFTLIELMVVVAIIGILASVAIPAYQDYTIRAQLVEGLTISNAVKPRIAEYYKRTGRFPQNNKEAGLPESKYLIGNYVQDVRVINGGIQITFGNKVNTRVKGKILTLRPQYVKETDITPLSWLCGGASVVKGMSVSGENRTNIKSSYLPGICR